MTNFSLFSECNFYKNCEIYEKNCINTIFQNCNFNDSELYFDNFDIEIFKGCTYTSNTSFNGKKYNQNSSPGENWIYKES
jgi:hypothetical protein